MIRTKNRANVDITHKTNEYDYFLRRMYPKMWSSLARPFENDTFPTPWIIKWEKEHSHVLILHHCLDYHTREMQQKAKKNYICSPSNICVHFRWPIDTFFFLFLPFICLFLTCSMSFYVGCESGLQVWFT